MLLPWGNHWFGITRFPGPRKHTFKPAALSHSPLLGSGPKRQNCLDYLLESPRCTFKDHSPGMPKHGLAHGIAVLRSIYKKNWQETNLIIRFVVRHHPDLGVEPSSLSLPQTLGGDYCSFLCRMMDPGDDLTKSWYHIQRPARSHSGCSIWTADPSSWVCVEDVSREE